MKVLVLVAVLFFFINITIGLKCYICDDIEYYNPYMDPEQNGVQACERTKLTSLCPNGSTFCLTHKFNACDNSEVCLEKGCDEYEVCKSVGTHETKHPFTGEKSVVDCCQGNLCNFPDNYEEIINLPSNHSKLSNQSLLFYALFSGIMSTVFVLL